MTLEQIRDIIIVRMSEWIGLPRKDITYPNDRDGPFDAKGRALWARFNHVPGLPSSPEIGAGPVVRRTGLIIVQLFVPLDTGDLAITRAADTLVSHFQFYTAPDAQFECFEASAAVIGNEGNGWWQVNVSIPYRAY
ncbi:phage tail terminator-like protein [Pseudomonas cremoricolorata]|uniref:Electron transfer flavoprotein subunit beta n=1 Tax=Pseudomonas cremoricolorata TaxID=157783 RepID=A0A089YFL6_9PSED|nr:phage tail terminator-like protein [Pseudomonas cremoricolorata]AIR90523.1 electron transfer flavoprotein subunit beta [Pseudomonas cremoricolorata]